MQHDFWDFLFSKNLHYKCYSQKAFSLQELIQFAHWDGLFEKKLGHKCYIWRKFSSMNWYNVFIQTLPFFEKLAVQMLHLKDFFPSWIDATCLFMSLFRKQQWLQMAQLNVFFSSWTVATCLFILPFFYIKGAFNNYAGRILPPPPLILSKYVVIEWRPLISIFIFIFIFQTSGLVIYVVPKSY